MTKAAEKIDNVTEYLDWRATRAQLGEPYGPDDYANYLRELEMTGTLRAVLEIADEVDNDSKYDMFSALERIRYLVTDYAEPEATA